MRRIHLMLVVIFTVVICATIYSVQASKQNGENFFVQLTEQEKLWLADHQTVRIAFDGHFPPYSFIDNHGELQGISVQMLELIGQKTGIEWQVDERYLWKDIYRALIDKQVDVVATMVARPDRRTKFDFTSPYVFKSLAILTHKENQTVRSRRSLSGKTIALVTDYQYSQRVLDEFKDVVPYYVDNMHDALMAVEARKVDAAILYLAAALFTQNNYNYSNIQFAAYYDTATSNDAIAVRKDWPILTQILEKGLKSISEQEKQQIESQWKSQLKVPVDHAVLLQLTIVFFLAMTLLAIWLVHTKAKNKKISEFQQLLLAANDDLHRLKSDLENEVSKRTSELQKSEKKYRNLIENLQEEYFFYQRDRNGFFEYISPSVTNVIGFDVEELIGEESMNLTDHPQNCKVKESISLCLKGAKSSSFEIEVFHKSGKKKIIRLLETPIFDEMHNVVGVEGIVQDVNSLRKSLEKS